MEKPREIKFRQPVFREGKFKFWHYWGFIGDETPTGFYGFIPPLWTPTKEYSTHGSQEHIGRLDKNGKSLYVGEIIEYPQTSFPLEVVWDEFNCSFMLKDTYTSSLLGMPSKETMAKHSVSIGNIHENPELLGEITERVALEEEAEKED